jgi:hypothetical protein
MAGDEHQREDVVVDPVGIPRQVVGPVPRARRARARLTLGELAGDPALIISSLQRPIVSSICSKGVSIIFATDSSVPRMISMYFAIFDLLDTGVRLSTLSSQVERRSRGSTRQTDTGPCFFATALRRGHAGGLRRFC